MVAYSDELDAMVGSKTGGARKLCISSATPARGFGTHRVRSRSSRSLLGGTDKEHTEESKPILSDDLIISYGGTGLTNAFHRSRRESLAVVPIPPPSGTNIDGITPRIKHYKNVENTGYHTSGFSKHNKRGDIVRESSRKLVVQDSLV